MTKDQLMEYIETHSREDAGCWIWTAGYCGNGQPAMRVNGDRSTVRSFIMAIIKGQPTPPGSVATNTCRCRKCVNPAHAINETKAKMLECSMRNTNQELRAARIAAAKVHERKLSDEDVQMILASDKTGLALAAELGVNSSLISHYRRRKSVRARMHANPFAGLGARA